MTTRNKIPLRHTLDLAALRRMAGTRSYARGEEYFERGHVRSLAEYAGTIAANVHGTREYRVKLMVQGRDIDYSCTCPVGDDGEFCKHCVAVGLAWLNEACPQAGKPIKEKSAKVKPAITMEDVRAHLAGQEKDKLVALVMEHAMDDDRLRQRLLMKAAKKGPKGLDLATYRKALESALATGGYVEYGEVHGYAQSIGEAIDSVEELLKEGHAAAVIELAEHALAAVYAAIVSVYDSDGYMGEILERLQALHLKACTKARPDPEALAQRLFEWELRTDWDTFYGAAERYAGVLGKEGLALYRALAEEQWERVPALSPGVKDAQTYGKRFRITHIMETLARASGDVEALIAIKKRDLSSAWAYVEIAEIYRQARKHDLALEWAERGLQAFPLRTDARLGEFLMTEYHRRKRHEDAMAIAWAGFAEMPYLSQYQSLKGHADRNDTWPAWREKALARLRAGPARPEAGVNARTQRWGAPARDDHSELVRIFLWEKDIEAAWREAKAGGCASDLWLELADKREKSHPEDALPVYRARIAPTLERKHNEAYREAIGLLRKVCALMVRLGRAGEFASYLESVRLAHKPKRNFMKLLAGEKWR